MPSSSFIGPTYTDQLYSRAVRFIIFADVRNYSKLSQEQTPLSVLFGYSTQRSFIIHCCQLCSHPHAFLVFLCLSSVSSFCTHFLNIVRGVIDLFLEQPAAAMLEDSEGGAATAAGAGSGAGESSSAATSASASASASATKEKRGKPSLLFFNTWGDGLFVVFADPVQCSRFALVLLQKVKLTRWQNWGLPPELTIRVGMHAGPVLVGWDPVVRHDNFFGPHVLYAQLIEPITTPGCAFATEQFAACLATSAEAHEFTLEYIGSSVLEKEFSVDSDDNFAELSKKEKQDYARCHLYNLTENKSFSATRVAVPVAGESGGQIHITSTAAAAAAVQAAAAVVAAGNSPLVTSAQQLLPSVSSSSLDLAGETGTTTLRNTSAGSTSSGGMGPPPLSRVSTHRGGRVGMIATSHSLQSSPLLGSMAGSRASSALGGHLTNSPMMSPSLTYSLLKLEELKTERENALQALELKQAQEKQAAAAAAAAKAAEADAHVPDAGRRGTGGKRRSHRASGGSLPILVVPPFGDFGTGVVAVPLQGGSGGGAGGSAGGSNSFMHSRRRNRSTDLLISSAGASGSGTPLSGDTTPNSATTPRNMQQQQQQQQQRGHFRRASEH
jgi:class 3 adenylate cyclase